MLETAKMTLLVLMMVATMRIYSRLPPTSHAKTVNYRMVEKKILDRILSPTIYDSQIRPKVQTSAANRLIGEVVQSQRGPLHPTRAVSWLKVPTSAFTFKTLC